MRRGVWWIVSFGVIVFLLLMSIEQTRLFLIALFLRIILFAKKYLIELLMAFFLVQGKFVFTLFMKKITLLSLYGLGKRYLIEKVINHHIKIHFLDYIEDDIKRLVRYSRQNFKRFPLVKQIVALGVFLTSLGIVGKMMGWMLAMKVFVAKFWSFILALVMKISTAIVFFFTDYLWGSWLAPLVEVLLFSWLLEWLEKIPLFHRYLVAIYERFITFFLWVEGYLERFIHLPLRRMTRHFARYVQAKIHTFIGYERVSSYQRLQEMRQMKPSAFERLKEKQKAKKPLQKPPYEGAYIRLKKRREARKEKID